MPTRTEPQAEPAQPRYTRIHRLLKVLTLVESGRAMTPQALAERCDVSERTIYRDLNEIEGAGFPIRFDPERNRYVIGRDRFLPPVQLTPDEALSVAVLCEQIAGNSQIPFTGPAWRAVDKILAGLPGSIRSEVDAVADVVCIRTARAVPPDGYEPVYERVRRAIAERRGLTCRYDSLNPESDNGEEFDFDPFALFFSVRAWYAVGMHHGRGSVRTLKLNRFAAIRLTERPYEIPGDFSIDSHLGNAWRMMRGDRDHDVAVRFDPEFAETIAETLWHPTQDVEHEDDGSVVFRCTVSGLDEIVWWILSMGPHCEVLEPRELRDRVRDAAAATSARYADPERP